jgi:hypothetical protein
MRNFRLEMMNKNYELERNLFTISEELKET